MSQLIISGAQAAGGAITSSLPSLSNQIASTAANIATSYVVAQAQNLIYGPTRHHREGPRRDALHLQTSSEGAGIAVLYGRARIAGEVIWAANFKEETQTTTTSTGGKGSRAAVETTQTEYLYSLSFAIGLAAGEIDGIGRVWADGKLISLADVTYRLYKGTRDQLPDSVIEAIEGAGNAPAYRDLAYIVFEDFPLKSYGNRLPQFSFEVLRALRSPDPDVLENATQAVALLPGSGEFAYGTSRVTKNDGEGNTSPENIHNNTGYTDFSASLDHLTVTLPNCRSAGLIVSWFGTDLRAGHCQIVPGVETKNKQTHPYQWSVGSVDRASAYLLSEQAGHPAFGGTPSDQSVIEALQALKAKNIKVMFYPFLLMDIPQGNQLPTPEGGLGQPAYPWRGRIRPEATDKTAPVATEISTLFGQAAISDFTITGQTVDYTGPAENSLRRMILHYAHLCKAAGGVDAFLIGSELRGITTARDAAGSYPAVAQLQALIKEVRLVLGPSVKLSYAADWSEYFGHHPNDGSHDIYFHLDSLWAEPDTDFIGIDNYMPLSDWRDGKAHKDYLAGYSSIYDPSYLQANIQGGEGYDYYYTSQQDRDGQIRTPIIDTAYGEDWVFRNKDLWGWWSHAHYNRPGGVKETLSTAWIPQSKPFWFTELGCAATDKASNQPNIFSDPKSSENGKPFYSSGQRDDMIQRRFIEAHSKFWQDITHNPTSAVYAGQMVDPQSLYLYAWDGRPFPDFPARRDVWADADNWQTGHWLNGRAGRVPIDLLVKDIAAASGHDLVEASDLSGLVTGYVLDRPMSPRAALEPLAGLYQFDALEEGDAIRFIARGGQSVATLSPKQFSIDSDTDYNITRSQAEDLPAIFQLAYIKDSGNYDRAIAQFTTPSATSDRIINLPTTVIMDPAEAEARARSLLADSLAMRDQISFRLPAEYLFLQPTDIIHVEIETRAYEFRLLDILDGEDRQVTAISTNPAAYELSYGATRTQVDPAPVVYGPPLWEMLDLPIVDETGEAQLFSAAYASPWPGGIALYRDNGTTPTLEQTIYSSAQMGQLQSDVSPGVAGRWDYASKIQFRLTQGQLFAADPVDVLSGANLIALQMDNGQWELIQYQQANLIGPNEWELSNLLRGQFGTEEETAMFATTGARLVIINSAINRVGFPFADRLTAISRLAGPFSELPGSDNFISRTDTFAGLGWRPLAPCHARVKTTVSGIDLSWIRRTRRGGDNWQVEEVPLGEEQELYEVDILNNGVVIRTIESSLPRITYSQAEIQEDFGGTVPGGAEYAIYQLSSLVGRGRAYRKNF
ncbi:MAG: baseplate multidomain protein megatron [bacterium]